MTDKVTKPWYASVTIISSILAVASGIFGDTMFGRFIEDPVAAENLASAITGLAGLFAIWGRVRASTGITNRKVKVIK